MSNKEQWYSNKELYEMMTELSKELAKTQMLIRDYNGLREKINDMEDRITVFEGQKTGGKEMWGYIVGGLGIIFALISLAIKV